MTKRKNNLEKEFAETSAWGLRSSIDLYVCNPQTIRSAKKIKKFAYDLCDLIEMKRYGPCRVVDFGEDPRISGFSMLQLIETSNLSAHFANATNTVYLDIFSCKYYDPRVAADFARKFFQAKSYDLKHSFAKTGNFQANNYALKQSLAKKGKK